MIDDDPSVRKSLCRLIKSFGYGVESYESADAFLRAEHLSPPDCLVCDVHMPGIGGFELRRRLQDQGDRTAVLFITAHADSRAREKALDGNAIGLLSKPFHDEDFKTGIDRGIRETSASRI